MIQDMIETLAAAKQAMEENPKLKTQVESLSAKVDDMDAVHQELQAKHASIVDAHNSTLNRVAELEAELEAARFRELASREKFVKLVSSISEAVNEVVPAVDPISDEPDVGVAGEHAEVQVAQTDEFRPWAKPQVTDLNDQSNSEALQQFSEVDRAISEGTAKAEADFRPSGSGSTGYGSETVAESRLEVNVPDVPAPYTNKPYSFKPEAVTWPEWVAGGGKRPWWLTDDELAKLSAA